MPDRLCFVECFGGDIGPVRPRDRRAVDKEFLEINFALQRREYRSGEPRFKVYKLLRAVVELYFDFVVSHVFSFCY